MSRVCGAEGRVRGWLLPVSKQVEGGSPIENVGSTPGGTKNLEDETQPRFTKHEEDFYLKIR